MDRLQHIVWPEIRELARQRIEKLGEKGIESVVLEAAVLLEAGWDDMCDEVWVVQVPPDVARYVPARLFLPCCAAFGSCCCMCTGRRDGAVIFEGFCCTRYRFSSSPSLSVLKSRE